MKTAALCKLIIAGSLGLCAMAQAVPPGITPAPELPGPAFRHLEKLPEIRRPVMPGVITPVPVPLPRPGPVHPVQPIRVHPIVMPVHLTVAGCVPIPDFSMKDPIAVTGNDGGCVDKPGKPTRPVPTPTRPRPIL